MTFADLPVGARFRYVGGTVLQQKVLPDRANYVYAETWNMPYYVDPQQSVEPVEVVEETK